jgi:aspartate kinase
MQQPGVFLDVLSTLDEGQVSVLQTSDSDYSLSMLVPEAETMRAVRILHEKFKLHEVV